MFERAVGAGAQIEFLHDGLVLLVSQKKNYALGKILPVNDKWIWVYILYENYVGHPCEAMFRSPS